MPLYPASPLFQIDGIDTPQHDKTLTLDQPVGDLPAVDDARWSSAATDNSLIALLVWVVLLMALQAVSWPLVRRLFTHLPDRGWAFSRLITLLVAGFGVWFLSSVELIAFRAIWAGVALIVVAGLSWLVSRRIRSEGEDPAWWRNPIIIGAEVVFWSVFALFLLYRLINPDSYHPIWGGEKPMEFAHLNAILRSAHFPPVDPWYSGGYINYYYYGTYLVAFLVKLTGIPSEIAFNLAQPTFPALLAAASFSIAAALGKRLTQSTGGALLTGLLGAFFIQFAGNFVVAERVLDRAFKGVGVLNDFSYWVFNPTRAIPDAARPINITEFPYFGALYADLHPHVIAMPFTILIVALAWQVAAQWRLLPFVFVRRRMDLEDAFALLVPLMLAALGLGTLFMTNAWDMPMYVAVVAVGILMATQGVPRVTLRLGVSALVILCVGLLAWVLILPFTTHYVALFGEIATVRDRSPLLGVESHLGGQILLMTFGMAAITLPRTRLRRTAVSMTAVGAAVLLALFLSIQWAGNEQETAWVRMGEAGVVGVMVGVWIMAAWYVTTAKVDFNVSPVVIKTLMVQTAALTLVLVVLDRSVLALYLGIGLSAAILWFTLWRPTERFIAALVAGGMLLGASLEVVYLVDDLSGTDWYRMNTIFKFYNQIWNLLGIAAAVLVGRAIWETVTLPGESALDSAGHGDASTGPSAWAWVSAALAVPVAIAAIAYAVVATPIRLDQTWGAREGLTLNAYSWMEFGEMPLFVIEEKDGQQQQVPADPLQYADDLAAIDWLNENVAGTPVIAEAAFGTYRCNGSRFSIATGLPTPVGWVRHQMQQRYPDDLVIREAALRELYTIPNIERQQGVIDRYNVEYVIVGQTERHYPNNQPASEGCIDQGSSQAIESLENLDSLELVFEHGSTKIYQVAGP